MEEAKATLPIDAIYTALPLKFRQRKQFNFFQYSDL